MLLPVKDSFIRQKDGDCNAESGRETGVDFSLWLGVSDMGAMQGMGNKRKQVVS